MHKTQGLGLTIQVLNNFKALWLGQPEIRQVVNTLRELYSQIELLNSLLEEGNVQSETLQICKQQMALQAVALVETIWVDIHQRLPLPFRYMKVYSYTDIYLAPAKLALSRCQDIYQNAIKLLPVLEEEGLLTTDTEQFNTTITLYRLNLEKEAVARQDLTTYTYTLAKLYQEAEHLLQTRLDVLIAPYGKYYPEFYIAYQQSRIQEPF